MNYHFTFRNMTFSNSLENYAKDRFGEVIEKHGRNTVDCYVTIESDRNKRIIKFDLSASNTSFHAEHASENFYESIDRSLDKLARQLRKHRNKQKPSSKIISNQVKRIDSLFDTRESTMDNDFEVRPQRFDEYLFEPQRSQPLKHF